ncbi:MAG: RIP metalloprotease RseP [bacterium]|nr:RIP metalloprotease RseP [bacterium]
MDFLNVVFAIIGIGLLIFVHEGGHFLAARAAGVRVEVFSLGFGPRLWGCQWRETDFRLSLVPFGGYVLVAGADPSDRRYPPSESLYAKTIAQRALFWSGGVIMNLLLALLVFPIVFSYGVDFAAPVVGSVREGSAAWVARLQPGDRILALEGREVRSFENLAVEIALYGQRPVELLIARNDTEQLVTVVPKYDSASGLYQLGINQAYGDFALEVTTDGPARTAGLQTGDVLVSTNGKPATNDAMIEVLDSGKPFEFEVRRGEQLIKGTVGAPVAKDPTAPKIGVTQVFRRVAGVRSVAWLDTLGLEPDDLVLAIDGRPFRGDGLAAYQLGPSRLVMHVARQGQEVVLEAPVTPEQRAELTDRIALAPAGDLRLLPSPDRPAALAGMRAADLVEAIDGKAIADWDELRETVEKSAGKPMRFRLRRVPDDTKAFYSSAERDLPRGEVVELTIAAQGTPQYDYGFQASAPLVQQELVADGFGHALQLGVICSLDLIKQSYVTLKRLITGDVAAKNLGGIIRITQVSYHASKRGPSWFWYFLALISVNLAFVNLLPIPVLDGGHLLFLLIEKVKGSPVSARVFGYSQIVGLVFVLLLVLFVTYNDILRLL